MQLTILGVYHSMACLCFDFDTHISMNVSRILTACATLLAVLESIVGDASCAAKLVVALPSMAGVFGVGLEFSFEADRPVAEENYWWD
jgi:hypothetical protein